MEVLYVIDIECFFSWLDKEIKKDTTKMIQSLVAFVTEDFLHERFQSYRNKSSSTMNSFGQTSLL